MTSLKHDSLRGLFRLGALFFGFSMVCQAQEPNEFLPAKHSRSHFDPIVERNPFVIEIEGAKEEEQGPVWSENLAVAYVTKIAGDYVVGVVDTKVKSKDPRERYQTVRQSSGANTNGIRLVNIKPNPNPREVEVILAKGGDQATIAYDEKLLKQPVKAASRKTPTKPGARTSTTKKPTTTSSRGRGSSTGKSNQPRRRVILPPGIKRN
ncbi:MAG: hypothetical protein AAF514_19805 [Verrucomicrobiota bacterium]